MVLYNLIISMLIGYEIHKMLKFKMFFKLRTLSVDYKEKLLKRTNSIAQKLLSNFALLEFLYLIIIVTGFFTNNRLFFLAIMVLMIIQLIIFKYIKNKIMRKIFYIFDIMLSFLLLSICLLNNFIFEMNGTELVKQFFK